MFIEEENIAIINILSCYFLDCESIFDILYEWKEFVIGEKIKREKIQIRWESMVISMRESCSAREIYFLPKRMIIEPIEELLLCECENHIF